MAWDACSGLKLRQVSPTSGWLTGLNGLGCPFGIEAVVSRQRLKIRRDSGSITMTLSLFLIIKNNGKLFEKRGLFNRCVNSKIMLNDARNDRHALLEHRGRDCH